MEKQDLNKMLTEVLNKRRDCIPLTKEEQKFVDETYNTLFEKKFGVRTFVCKTGEEIRKADITKKAKDAQPDAPISKDVKFNEKDKKIENDDPSGTVKATEEGEYVDVDEKKTGTEAREVNASDIINSDKEDDERKPVFKFGDVVIRTTNGKHLAGLILKYHDKEKAASVKWANGTFSTIYVSQLVKAIDAIKEKEEVAEDTVVPPDPAMAPKEEIKAPVEKAEEEVTPAEHEATETPEEEAKETPEEQAKEEEAGTEEHSWEAPLQDELKENEYVDDSEAIMMFVRTNMTKAESGVVAMPLDEVKKSNPRLAEAMEKKGYKAAHFAIGKKA
jgi:hypothetical protein